MSKLSFRARALDASKPLPVYRADEIPEAADANTINRAVPQLPSGMEKEEELETHLQRALTAQQVYGTTDTLVIPIPAINDGCTNYDLYKPDKDFRAPKQFIHVQPFGMEQEIPDYDMDSEDETWLDRQSRKLECSQLKFETMMDRLEKGSGQTVMTLQEAKALLKEDDDLIIAVYDYWLNKRLRLQYGLIPTVKTEKRDGTNSSNPYVAFRRRTEKMQTRKNRKNDEVSYEKMLKLRRDLSKALTLLEMVKRREKSKKELLQLTIEVLEKRYTMQDFDGKAFDEANAKRHTLPPSFLQSFTEYLNSRRFTDRDDQPFGGKPRRRKYAKRKERAPGQSQASQPVVHIPQYTEVDVLQHDGFTSEEEELSAQVSSSEHEAEAEDPDGVYAFRRKAGVAYQAPINNGFGNWPWHGPEEGGMGDSKYRYSLASISSPHKCIGYARRRVGRGGRVMFDRAMSEWDDGFDHIDLSSPPSSPSKPATPENDHMYAKHIKDATIPFFCPHDPPQSSYKSRADGIIDPLDLGSRGLGVSTVSGMSVNSDDDEAVKAHYQSHCEKLLQIQRQQNEQLLLADDHGHSAVTSSGSLLNISNNSSKPPSIAMQQAAIQTRRTIDTSMAEAALSAVIKNSTPASTTTVVKQTSIPAFVTIQESVPGTSQLVAPVPTIRNGPVTVTGSSVGTTNIVFANSGAEKVIKVSSFPKQELHSSRRPTQIHYATIPDKDSVPKENHDGNNHIIREKNVVMEVT